jgi:hypothetical protein
VAEHHNTKADAPHENKFPIIGSVDQ